jgi:hypothetical protein
MKYHFVYQTASEEKILEVDSELEPPSPGEYLQLRSTHDGQELAYYVVKEIYFAPESQDKTIFFIEVEPI